MDSDHRAEIDTWALYKPLNALLKQVRLLTSIPSEFTNDICYTLEKVLLGERPSYETLSYAWGSPQFKRQIYLDEAPFNAAENLESALRYLRCGAVG